MVRLTVCTGRRRFFAAVSRIVRLSVALPVFLTGSSSKRLTFASFAGCFW